MSKVAIVTDSTFNFSSDTARNYPLFSIPLHIIWGDKVYLDGVDITPEQFYEKLKTSKDIPTTSQPSPAAFHEMYVNLLEQGYDILSIHISSKLSGTLDSAIQAKNMLPGSRIQLVDSLSTSYAMGFHVLAAARLAAQGATLEECKAEAEKAKTHSGVFFLLNTLEFLHRGGRIGGAAAFMGTMLNLKPILELRDGRVEAVERVRTTTKAIDRLLHLFEKAAGRHTSPIRIAALHADTPEDAQTLLQRARDRFGISDVNEVMLGRISPVLGVHTGPGALGIAYMAGM